MKFTDALRGYAFDIHNRDQFKCVYCGLDGTESFDNWIQLSQDHLLPSKYPQREDPEYIVTACSYCNGADNWYFKKANKLRLNFDGLSRQELIDQRMPFVKKVRDDYRGYWTENVIVESTSVTKDELSLEKKITSIADMAINHLILEFSKSPTRFYTENDLRCRLVHLLYSSLEKYGFSVVSDADGDPHQLVHCEYPTPFRCDMSDHNFEIKSEDDVPPNGGKYGRGHFDVAVLNPSFIKKHKYSDLKGQSYSNWKLNISDNLTDSEPAIIMGIEIMYERDDLTIAGMNSFVSKILQDHQKLEAGCNSLGFMKAHSTLAFVKGSETSICNQLSERLTKYSSISLIMPNQES